MKKLNVALLLSLVFCSALFADALPTSTLASILTSEAAAAAAAAPAPTAPFYDPTKPLIEQDILHHIDLNNYQVNFIISGNNQKMATINEKNVHIGDKISGYRIIDIKKNDIVLTKGGQEWTLSLNNSILEKDKALEAKE
jgi:hypothetical protein